MSDNGLCIKAPQTLTHVGWHRDSNSWQYEGYEPAASTDGRRTSSWSEADRLAWAACRSEAIEAPMEKIKVMIFVDDIDAATGAFSVMPGTHRLAWGSALVDTDGAEHTPEEAREGDPGRIPGHVKLTGKPDDVLFWNGSIFHAAMPNTDTKPRRLLLYNFVHAPVPDDPDGTLRSRGAVIRTGRDDDALGEWLDGGAVTNPQLSVEAPSVDVLRQLLGQRRSTNFAELATGTVSKL